jgi:hypothetical protein
MPDKKISELTDGVYARSDDRTPIARTPFGPGDNRRLTPQAQAEYTKRFAVEGAAASINTAGAVTYTSAQLLAGTIVRDPNGLARTDTLPTAALLVAAMIAAGHCQIGSVLNCLIINGADAAELITLAAGAGGTFDAAQVTTSRSIAQNTSKTIKIRITNITLTTEAYVVYA